MKTLILLFLFCFLVTAQDKPAKTDLRVKYDRIEDRTNISTKQRGVKSTGGVLVTAYFNHPGSVLTAPVANLALMFDVYSPDWRFLRESDQRLFVLSDDQRFQFDNPRRESEANGSYSRYSAGNVHERLIFAMPRETVEQILKGSKIEMKLGSIPFELRQDTLKDLKAIVAVMNPKQIGS